METSLDDAASHSGQPAETPDETVLPLHLAKKQFYVLLGSLLIGTAIILWAAFDTPGMAHAAALTKKYMLEYLDKPLMLAYTAFPLLAAVLIFSPWGRVRLGEDGEAPAFKTVTWMFMMFSAGVGATMVFWLAAEPLFYLEFKRFNTVTPHDRMVDLVLASQLVGWGLHNWACYALVGMAIGYFGYRRKQSLTFSTPIQIGFSAFLPGKPAFVSGVAGDCLAVVGMLFGIGASLAIGTLMISSGLSNLSGGLSWSAATVGVLVLGVLMISSLSASLSGMKRGLALAANVNIVLAIAMLVYLICATDAVTTVSRFGHLLFAYPVQMFKITVQTFTGTPDDVAWIREWPLAYFFWTISWSPFVGAFLAEISRGRTIRQTLLVAILFPTLFAGLWMAVVGGWTLDLNTAQGGVIATAVAEDVANGMFLVLDPLPGGGWIKMIAVLLAAIFLVTTGAAGILILGVLSTGRNIPGKRHQVFWAVALSAVAAVVVVTGSVEVVRAAPVFAAGPLIVLGLVAVITLLRFIARENR